MGFRAASKPTLVERAIPPSDIMESVLGTTMIRTGIKRERFSKETTLAHMFSPKPRPALSLATGSHSSSSRAREAADGSRAAFRQVSPGSKALGLKLRRWGLKINRPGGLLGQ